jgi:hypothetical protein
MDVLLDEIPTKQKEISVTVMPNGNIRLGNLQGGDREFMPATPSGDPMHYMYEGIGAIYNANTNKWEMMGLVDLTTSEMRKVLLAGPLTALSEAPLGGTRYGCRVNMARKGSSNTVNEQTLRYLAVENSVIEVINLTSNHALAQMASYEGMVTPTSLNYAFAGCTKLKSIYGRLSLGSCNNISEAFSRCRALVRVRLQKLNRSISLSASPLLDKESLLYMIQQAAPTSPITIAVHADVYAWAMADADILAALKAQPNVSLVTA